MRPETRSAIGRKAGPLAWALLGAFVAVPRLPPAPTSWDVQLTVSARGEYGLEGRDVRIDGRYAFAIVWTGSLSADDEDYLLVHGGTKTVEWTAEEKSSGPERMTIFTTNDFPDRPELKVNYILKMADGLHVDFIVRGFDVPLVPPAESFYLHLPASAENDENPAGLKYNLSVVSGSNAVVVDEQKIRKGSAEETFRWLWKRRGWVQRVDQTILESNIHTAEAKVVISPRR